MYSLNVEPLVLLQAMSDRTRLRLLKLLVSLPAVEACLCELGDSLEEPEYNISRHLKILRQAGFLSFRKEGRWVYHRFNTDGAIKPFRRLIADLPDSDGSFVEDLKRLKAELLKRKSGRCAKEGADFGQPLIRTSRRASS
ncbi:MAG: metalloregulator ArsR/SmtB family transcription factor [Bdellovibrionales bacterium]|nr:metalloregulator ArsR/SmtB family transcription factor [Bdellovibrionales bacterium]